MKLPEDNKHDFFDTAGCCGISWPLTARFGSAPVSGDVVIPAYDELHLITQALPRPYAYDVNRPGSFEI